MAKHKKRTGILILHYYPFRERLPKGTVCDIISEDDENYEVKFKIPGYGGTYTVGKHIVKEV